MTDNTTVLESPQLYDERYFHQYRGGAYERSELWLMVFAHEAETIIAQCRPATVLDIGCALGFLVEALRDRGVQAFGLDLSRYAIENVRDDLRPFCSVGSVLEPISRRYALIVCREVLEHVPAHDAQRAVANVCQATDDIVFSSSLDHADETQVNVQPPEYWATLFARSGFVRDLEFNLGG